MTKVSKRFTARFRDSLSRHPREVLRQFAGHPSDRTFLVLAVFLALGLYFRLWNIEHLFSIIHDYDEGAYSLAGRLIAEGYVPYRDFLFVHPPGHVYVLSALYRVFGYSFFLGRYLAVAASIGAGLLLYLAGRKLYAASIAGLTACALMLLETQMVYLGRRTVQESLGLLLVCGALALTAHYLAGGRRRLLVPAGLLLGLAVAVKYIMAPAVFGIALGIAVVELPASTWRRLTLLGRPFVLVVGACLSLVAYSFLMLLRWSGISQLPLPFSDMMPPGLESWIVTLWVFVLPFLAALLLAAPRQGMAHGILGLRAVVTCRSVWTLGAFVLIGFFGATAYFWVSMPGEFLRQTVFLQGNRPVSEFPSLIAFVRDFGFMGYLGFLRMAMLPVLFVVPAMLLLLNRRDFARTDCFLAVALAGGLLVSQWLFHLPRYYASIYPLLFLGICWMAPRSREALHSVQARVSLVFLSAVLLVAVNVNVILLKNYTAYDTLWPVYSSEEEYVYRETADYLRSVDAKKVYVTSPAYVAFAGDLDSTLAFDTFALLWLENLPAEAIVEALRTEGVDYVGIDRWTREWGYPYRAGVNSLVNEIRLQGTRVEVISPESLNKVEVYRLGHIRPAIVNSTFEYWSTVGGQPCPLGWEPLLVSEDGDVAAITSVTLAEVDALQLSIYEDGIASEKSSTHAGIVQGIAFPREAVTARVMPNANTVSLGATPLGPAIHFLDGDGHSVVLGFSDAIEREEVRVHDSEGYVSVIRPAALHRWSEHSIDVATYWKEAGWEVPEEIAVLVVLSAHADHPGYYTFHMASIALVEGDK